MSAVEWQQLGEGIATIANAMLLGAFLAGMLGRSFGHLVADLVRWAMRRVPSWRRWQRAKNRIERLEHAEWLRLRREQIQQRQAVKP